MVHAVAGARPVAIVAVDFLGQPTRRHVVLSESCHVAVRALQRVSCSAGLHTRHSRSKSLLPLTKRLRQVRSSIFSQSMLVVREKFLI